MRVSVNRDRCAGAGQCVATVPEVFDQDDEGVVVVLEPEPAEEHRDRVKTAVAHCPVSAIEASGI